MNRAVDVIDDKQRFTGIIADLVASSLSDTGLKGAIPEPVIVQAPRYAAINFSASRNLLDACFNIAVTSVSGQVKTPNPVKENIVKKIDGLSDNPDYYEDGEAPPNAGTKDDARNLILGLYPSGFLAGADVYPYFGAIHISWATSRKKVKLIIPPRDSNQHPSIYHGQMQNGRVVSSGIEPNATVKVLLRWLEWLPG
jgi:hypothetical protein